MKIPDNNTAQSLRLKTDKIIEKEVKKEPFIDTSLESVAKYIFQVFQKIQEDRSLQRSVLEVICQAFHKDSAMILSHMQNPEILHGKDALDTYDIP